MLIDFTEEAVTAIPHEKPRSLVIRIADHPDYEGFIDVPGESETALLREVEDETFEHFNVHELWVRRDRLKGGSVSFWIFSARTDGDHIDQCQFIVTVQHEGGNGWWVQIRRQPTGLSVGFLAEAVFRLPLPDFDPDFEEPLEPVIREPDWAKLASEED